MESLKQVFYKGKPYMSKVTLSGGERRFSIYENGVLTHFVREDELDKRVPVAIRIDRLFNSVRLALFA